MRFSIVCLKVRKEIVFIGTKRRVSGDFLRVDTSWIRNFW